MFVTFSINTHTHVRTRASTQTHTLNGLFSGTTQVSRDQKGKNILDFTEARDSEWKWHQLGMQVCTSLQHPTTQSFLQAGSPSCRPTNSVKALKAFYIKYTCILQSPLPVGVSSIRKHTKLQYDETNKQKTNQMSNVQKCTFTSIIQGTVNMTRVHCEFSKASQHEDGAAALAF